MHRKPSVVSPKLAVAVLLIILVTACSTPGETETPESATQVVQATATATTPPPEPTLLPSVEPVPDGLVQVPVPESARETAGRLMEAEHPPRDDYRNAEELLGMKPDEFLPEITDPKEFKENYSEKFFIIVRPGSDDYKQVTAQVRHVSENAVWWKASGSRLLDSEIDALATRYEEVVEPINHLAFGREWSPGIDNDRRVHFLLVDEDDYGGTFGYFSSINEFPTALQPNSNQKEMLVINTARARLDSDSSAGKLAHELQHLIHWNLDPNEDLWLNEAMGELAYFFTGAPEPSSALGLTNAEYFAENPDMQLTSRPERRYGEEDKSTYIHYAGEKLFMIYLLEQFGPQFIKDLANNPNPGVFSIQEELDKLPGSPRFEDVFANWLVANLIDRPQIDEGQYGYADHDPVPLILNRTIVRPVDDEPFEGQLPPYGAHYYEIHGSGTTGVTFNGSTLARLTPADPPSGEYAWYSSRGDNSDFSLTNTFDLSGLDSATFEYKIWYELEEFYDFAYVEVSTDGGETWQILETANGTDNDPRDRSYGWGYTGTTLEWLEESLDLTPYTGQEIMVRFHVLTDFTTNRDGIQVDDTAIPELGYFDSAEDESGGWEARGFIRSTNLVPVEWIVWLIKASNPFQVERITLTPEQMAEFEIEGFGEQFNVAAVVVSPTAPTTTMEVDYAIEFHHP
jgi:immune inhibitor A